MKRFRYCFLASALLVVPVTAQEKGTSESDGIDGVWILRSAEKGGKSDPRTLVELRRFTFENGRLFIPDATREIRVEINTRSSPKELDLVSDSMRSKLIFELREDQLTICGPLGDGQPSGVGRPRPTKFATAEDNSHSLLVFTRKPKVDWKKVPTWMKPKVIDGVMVSVGWTAITRLQTKDDAGRFRNIFADNAVIMIVVRIDNLNAEPLDYWGWRKPGERKRDGRVEDHEREASGEAILKGKDGESFDRLFFKVGIPRQTSLAIAIEPGGRLYDFLTFDPRLNLITLGSDLGPVVLTLHGEAVGVDGSFVMTIPDEGVENAFAPDHLKHRGMKPPILDAHYFLDELPKNPDRKQRLDAWEAELAQVAKGGAARAAAELRAKDGLKGKGAGEAKERAEVRKREAEARDIQTKAAERVAKEKAAAADRKAKEKMRRDETADVALLQIVGKGASVKANLLQLPAGKKTFVGPGQSFGNGKWKVINVDANAGLVTILDPNGKNRVLKLKDE